MPTLNWIGKEKVVSHHQDVPFRLLEHKYSFNTEDKSKNKIIHGDNLEVLKALLPEYEGRIKCIYIDPPYNTGKDIWRYNDKVEHPTIKKWLDKIVGKESEDLTRHDKWLCMMYPRLVLLQKLLSPEGIIFISIDDNELYFLKIIMNEIFGMGNFIGNIIWETATDNNPRQISTEHEYVLCYGKDKDIQQQWVARSIEAELIQDQYEIFKKEFKEDIERIQLELRKWIKANKNDLNQVTHYDNVDIQGVYHDADVANTKFGGYKYNIIHPVTGKVCKIPDKGFRFPEATMNDLINNNDIVFGVDETTLIKPKKRLENVRDKLRSIIYEDGRAATKEIEQMFSKDFFKNPKSVNIIKRLLKFCTNKNDIVLDCFAGSGTTAQAVLELNLEDGDERNFILVEMETYAETITSERVKKVITGYGQKKGTGSDFCFYGLGPELFSGENNGFINDAVDTKSIREYIWFSETRSEYISSDQNDSKYFLGKCNDAAYYLFYEQGSSLTLDYDTLSAIRTKAGQYIIYAGNCLLSKEFMLKNNIFFKKIAQDILRF